MVFLFAACADSRAGQGQGGDRDRAAAAVEMEMDLTQRLPEDVLADVLRRLPPRSLAAARCICRAWHAIIDARRLLDPDLLPLSLAGFFIQFTGLEFTEFFFRPSLTDTAISDLHFMPTDDIGVEDICNGLVLLYSYVVNPATRRWASLPPRPPPPMGFECFSEQNYIVFDPAVSLHYQVLMFLHVPCDHVGLDDPLKQQEWPPSRFMMHVFSSETTRWEERSFIRQGDALGTLADMQLVRPSSDRPNAVYWHGELYVHSCNFVMRISLSNSTYQVIKLPTDEQYTQVLLGRSEKGVYFAALDRQCRLRVWILPELFGQNKWILRHDNNVHNRDMPARQSYEPQICGPWIIADVNYNFDYASNPFYKKKAPVLDEFEWYSDNEDVFETRIEGHRYGHITILGFHPYKEVIFLSESLNRGLACHLDNSKVEELGCMRPKDFDNCYNKEIDQTFPYTPCWFGPFLD